MTCRYMCAAVETSTYSVFLNCSRSINITLEKYSTAERKEGRKEGRKDLKKKLCGDFPALI